MSYTHKNTNTHTHRVHTHTHTNACTHTQTHEYTCTHTLDILGIDRVGALNAVLSGRKIIEPKNRHMLERLIISEILACICDCVYFQPIDKVSQRTLIDSLVTF